MITRATENVATTMIGGQTFGEDVPPDHVAVAGAEGARRRHELALGERQRLPAHDPRVGHPAAEGEHQR